MIRSGASIAYSKSDAGILALNHVLGLIDVVFAAGDFEVWHSKSTSVWDAKQKCRVVQPSSYLVIKQMGTGHTLLGMHFVKCKYAFAMRYDEVDNDSWREIKDECLRQAVLLCAWEGDTRGK